MLRVLSALLISMCFIVTSAQAQTLIPAAPQLAAKSWILIDANTGRVLVEENADLPLPPASLTKMMSTYVVAGEMASGKFTHADKVPISVTAWKMGGSKMFVREGTEVLLGDLLKGIIIQSGNDATVALAEHLAGSESAFADVMNQQAVLLGMNSSYFVNATGWPAEGHVTTARDLSLLAQAIILEHPEHYALYSEKYYEYNGIKQPNRNRLLWRDKSVDGMKTGHTEEAGYCLVASAERNGMRLISVVMGTRSEEARAQESQKLLTYGFRYYETDKVFSAGDVLQADNRVWFGEEDSVDLVLADDVFLTFPRGARAQLESNIHVDATLEAPLTQQQELGRLVVTYKGEVLADKKLVASQPIAEAGFFSRLWDRLVQFVMSLL
ncbi:serine-type D-Ala-D-Ala carboxypeptidase [Gammaproteobacteria bacterium 50_400_T64]|nr:serine-type D-Ala-D-Ala carboxypeptidase [Gammaproteobacteria bacterium 50_400_T64]